MKKIFLFILLILGLGACVNPMDKYTSSLQNSNGLFLLLNFNIYF